MRAAHHDPRRASRRWGPPSTTRSGEAVEGADAVMMLRIQHERIGDPLIPTTARVLAALGPQRPEGGGAGSRPGCVVLHPGPINRGVELAPDVADGPRSVILDQVENGVAVRMAILVPAGRRRRGRGQGCEGMSSRPALHRGRPGHRPRQRHRRACGRWSSRDGRIAEVGRADRAPARRARHRRPGPLGHAGLRRPARPPARARPGVQGDHRHGRAAAVAGGFTAVCAMPNTKPVNDNAR